MTLKHISYLLSLYLFPSLRGQMAGVLLHKVKQFGNRLKIAVVT